MAFTRYWSSPRIQAYVLVTSAPFISFGIRLNWYMWVQQRGYGICVKHTLVLQDGLYILDLGQSY